MDDKMHEMTIPGNVDNKTLASVAKRFEGLEHPTALAIPSLPLTHWKQSYGRIERKGLESLCLLVNHFAPVIIYPMKKGIKKIVVAKKGVDLGLRA